ncbi:MAG: type IV secretory system conjugative DNA transfer family protein, partial [Burkholderiaceae bacterium]
MATTDWKQTIQFFRQDLRHHKLAVALWTPVGLLYGVIVGFLLALACGTAVMAGLGLIFLVFRMDDSPGSLANQLGNAALTGTIIMTGLGGFVMGFLRPFRVKPRQETHGSARLATAAEVAPLTQWAGPLIGRDMKSGQLLRYPGTGHLLTMAPTRTGKGVGTVIPNLLRLNRPIICIDPKGENVRATAHTRRQMGPVHVLDPFGITDHADHGGAAFNPLAALDPNDPDLVDDVAELADALVHDDQVNTADPHWNEEAKALINGIMLYVVTAEPREHRNLATVRDYLTRSPKEFEVLLDTMQLSDAAGGLVRRAANRHLSKSSREAAGVLSSAMRHTYFLDSTRMTDVMSRSDFSFGDLKRGPVTVYLVLPPDRMATYARWLRLMVVQSLQALSRGHPDDAPALPVLYLLDEFAALGYLAPIERAMGLMAGYGVQLWPILQDIHQLRALYGKRADTFISNAGVLQVFGVNDMAT